MKREKESKRKQQTQPCRCLYVIIAFISFILLKLRRVAKNSVVIFSKGDTNSASLATTFAREFVKESEGRQKALPKYLYVVAPLSVLLISLMLWKIANTAKGNVTILLGILFVILLSTFIVGLWSSNDRLTRELGMELLSGTIISFAIVYLGIADTIQQKRAEENNRIQQERAEENNRRDDLILTLGTHQELPGIDIRRKDLSRTYLPGKNLSGANLAGTILTEADLGGTNLRGAVFGEMNLKKTVFTRAILREAKFFRPDLRGADLRGANLIGANLTEAVLTGAKLGGANFTGANLTGAILFGVDFREVIGLRSVINWQGSWYDQQTRWPSNFDPSAIPGLNRCPGTGLGGPGECLKN